jgi:tetratricopeptide (TPR) repeat protein
MEFSTPRHLYKQWKGQQLKALDTFRIDPGAILAGLPSGEEAAIREAVSRRAVARRLLAAGLAAGQEQKTDEQYAAYRTAAEASPDDRMVAEALSRLLGQMGFDLVRNNEVERAMTYLVAAVEAGPEFPQPHYYLGVAHLHLHRIEEARAELEKALELDPHYPDAHLSMALVYDALDMVPEQIRALESYLENAPTPSKFKEVRARLEELKREPGAQAASRAHGG